VPEENAELPVGGDRVRLRHEHHPGLEHLLERFGVNVLKLALLYQLDVDPYSYVTQLAVHQAFSAGQFGAVYDGSAPEMKNSLSRDQFAATFGGIYSRTGAFKSGKTTGWKVNYGTDGNFVVLNRDAQFEHATGTEEFVFRVEGKKAVLAGYHVKTSLPVE